MIQNAHLWNAWERAWLASQKPNFQQSLRIFESMLTQARHLGAFPPKNPLEGFPEKILFVQRLHVRSAA